MAPMTLPSVSLNAEAFSVVGITSPDALRGWSLELRVTPRSTTSRSAIMNSRVRPRASVLLVTRYRHCSCGKGSSRRDARRDASFRATMT
jgi:hypothetical protein